jgi:anti-sigma B factor antagonist
MDHQHSHIGIEIVERGDVVVVVVEGEFDLSAAPDFIAGLGRVVASRAPAIVIDLDRVTFMDSAGVHALLRVSDSEGSRNRLAFTRGSPQVQRLLEVTGTRRYLSFVPSPGR